MGTDGSIPASVPITDLAASFQHSVIDQLVTRRCRSRTLWCVGDPAQRRRVGQQDAALRHEDRKRSVPVYWPPLWLCTDNAAMIGAAAHFRFLAGQRAGWDLDIDPNLKLVD